MSFLNNAPKFLWDRDKLRNLTPNDAYNFAYPPFGSPTLPEASEPLKLLGMTLLRLLGTMAASGLWGAGPFHKFQTPHYIICRDLHPRDPLLDDWPLLPWLLSTRSPTKYPTIPVSHLVWNMPIPSSQMMDLRD